MSSPECPEGFQALYWCNHSIVTLLHTEECLVDQHVVHEGTGFFAHIGLHATEVINYNSDNVSTIEDTCCRTAVLPPHGVCCIVGGHYW